MNQVWLYTIGSVIIVSLISLIGIVSLVFQRDYFQRIIFVLVAFAAGSLLGDAFIHILPEISRNGLTLTSSMSILSGVFAFFILEKIIHWRHCHAVNCKEHSKSLGTLNIIGDILHNFIDGAVIAGSFLVSIPLGISTALAVVFHEIPHELGNFGILVHSGFSRYKALLFNFLTAICAIFGAIFVLIIGEGKAQGTIDFVLPFTLGGFIYVALSDLVPELHKETSPSNTLIQLVFLVFGIGIMTFMLVIG
jgi:zinc and cadmium transporter